MPLPRQASHGQGGNWKGHTDCQCQHPSIGFFCCLQLGPPGPPQLTVLGRPCLELSWWLWWWEPSRPLLLACAQSLGWTSGEQVGSSTWTCSVDSNVLWCWMLRGSLAPGSIFALDSCPAFDYERKCLKHTVLTAAEQLDTAEPTTTKTLINCASQSRSKHVAWMPRPHPVRCVCRPGFATVLRCCQLLVHPGSHSPNPAPALDVARLLPRPRVCKVRFVN